MESSGLSTGLQGESTIVKLMKTKIGWDSNDALTLGNAKVLGLAILEITSKTMDGVKATLGAQTSVLLISTILITRSFGIMDLQEIGTGTTTKLQNL